jgi:hypothetical protein
MSTDPHPIDPRIPVELHPAVRVAREQWRALWPRMELDGTADLIVMALAHHAFLWPHGQRTVRTRGRRNP